MKHENGMLRFSHQAMATEWEILISHNDQLYAEQAARAAFDMLNRLEQDLSRYLPNSDISRINRAPANEAVIVGVDTFECLHKCRQLHEQTFHAFDITIGRLIQYHKNSKKSGIPPDSGRIKSLHKNTGMHLLKLNEDKKTVSKAVAELELDLGGFGKGYTVDRMADELSEWDIRNFMIHGGMSSVYAAGRMKSYNGWKVTISHPEQSEHVLRRLLLSNVALSASGLRKGSHVIDPRTGMPAQKIFAAWSLAPDAATGDTLSTALLILSEEERARYFQKHFEQGGFVLTHSVDAIQIRNGLWPVENEW